MLTVGFLVQVSFCRTAKQWTMNQFHPSASGHILAPATQDSSRSTGLQPNLLGYQTHPKNLVKEEQYGGQVLELSFQKLQSLPVNVRMSLAFPVSSNGWGGAGQLNSRSARILLNHPSRASPEAWYSDLLRPEYLTIARPNSTELLKFETSGCWPSPQAL